MDEKKKIFVADDDPAILDALKIILEEVGYEVETSVNGRIFQTNKEHLPDLLLLDIWMSGLDGGAICKQLKTQDLTKHIPVIMISANKDLEQITKDAGADDFIEKPFQMVNLLAKIDTYINLDTKVNL